MARVTVEDCLDVIQNRFTLAMLAGHRAKEISKGAPIKIDSDNDKNTVIALREIAGYIQSAPDLEKAYIRSMQKLGHTDEVNEQESNNFSGDHANEDGKAARANLKPQIISQDHKDIEESFLSVEDYVLEDESDPEEQ